MANLYKKRHKWKIYAILYTVLAIAVFCLFAVGFHKYMLPAAIKISTNYAVTLINNSINNSVNSIVSEDMLTTENFFTQTSGDEGKLNTLTVNSILINDFCNKAASEISADLNAIEEKPVLLPLGSITGIALIANKGPKIKVHIFNNGNTTVDYDTSFASVGINQVNFQIWLNVRCETSIYLPLYENQLVVNRKIMLVNTVFSGDTPYVYLNK